MEEGPRERQREGRKEGRKEGKGLGEREKVSLWEREPSKNAGFGSEG